MGTQYISTLDEIGPHCDKAKPDLMLEFSTSKVRGREKEIPNWNVVVDGAIGCHVAVISELRDRLLDTEVMICLG